MRKIIGLLLLIGGISFSTYRVVQYLKLRQEIKNNFLIYWDMADKSSTIKGKLENLEKFSDKLKSYHLEGLNSKYIYPNLTSDFNNNLKAFSTLVSRLKDISTMDENSFAYQTAMHQITEQEQGQAGEMISVFSDCYTRKYHESLLNPLTIFIFVMIQFLLIAFGFGLFSAGFSLDYKKQKQYGK